MSFRRQARTSHHRWRTVLDPACSWLLHLKSRSIHPRVDDRHATRERIQSRLRCIRRSASSLHSTEVITDPNNLRNYSLVPTGSRFRAGNDQAPTGANSASAGNARHPQSTGCARVKASHPVSAACCWPCPACEAHPSGQWWLDEHRVAQLERHTESGTARIGVSCMRSRRGRSKERAWELHAEAELVGLPLHPMPGNRQWRLETFSHQLSCVPRRK